VRPASSLSLRDGKPPVGPAKPYCTFRLGEGLFGIDIGLVHSVNLPPTLTPIPHAPAIVRGYANLRGQIQLVMDIKRLLGFGPIEMTPETRLVLFQPIADEVFGVLVDRIGDIARLRPDQIEKRRPPELPGTDEAELDEELLSGVGKLDGELLILLDARQLPHAVRRVLAN
jgi:chemotaxis signal transduction protein